LKVVYPDNPEIYGGEIVDKEYSVDQERMITHMRLDLTRKAKEKEKNKANLVIRE